MQKLSSDEHVVCIYAERYAGPGWANSLLVAIIMNRRTQKIREEWFQPSEQSRLMLTLFPIAATVHAQLKAEAERMLTPRRKVSNKKR